MPVAGETTHVRQLWLLSMVRLRSKSCPRKSKDGYRGEEIKPGS